MGCFWQESYKKGKKKMEGAGREEMNKGKEKSLA